jgi:mono/diheme cytochrome c family protein
MTARRKSLLAGAALLVLALPLLAWPAAAAAQQPDPQLPGLGREIYATHCAACHGENLEGQPNWQAPLPDGKMPAPPLDASGHAPHHPEQQLFQVVKGGMASVNGGKPTDMPAFEGVLSDEEIGAVLAYIRSHW